MAVRLLQQQWKAALFAHRSVANEAEDEQDAPADMGFRSVGATTGYDPGKQGAGMSASNVVFLNNYPMHEALRLVEDGDMPAPASVGDVGAP